MHSDEYLALARLDELRRQARMGELRQRAIALSRDERQPAAAPSQPVTRLWRWLRA